MRRLAALFYFVWPQCRSYVREDAFTTYCYSDLWHRGPHRSFSGHMEWR